MLPRFVTAIKTITYDIEDLKDRIFPDLTDEEIIDYIDTEAYDELGIGYRLVDPDTMEDL
jgi:hypothetical protein